MAGDILYCVGCGGPVAESSPGVVLAISCRCGALAPILRTGDGKWATPASLLMATGNRLIPHLEYYLGFSGHQSPIKDEVTRQLRALGSISYTECPDKRCWEAWQRSREHHQERERSRRHKP